MSHVPHWLIISSRVAAAIFGGYVFAWGFTALVVAVTVAISGDYDEGLTLAYLLAFVVYVSVLLWAFAAPRLTRVWLVLVGGGVALTGAASVIMQSFNPVS